MHVALYQEFRNTLESLPFDGRIMPYDWGALPSPRHPIWVPYSLMFDEFSRELSNAINAFTTNVKNLQAWAIVLAPLSIDQKFEAVHEFVDNLATVAVNSPYMLRSRFIFSVSHLCHQANVAIVPDWKDDLPLDGQINMSTANRYGERWSKYAALKDSLEAISGRSYTEATHNFRNTYNHRFSPRFVIGVTQLVTRTIDKATARVEYRIEGLNPLGLDAIAHHLVTERNSCYLAFDAFQALVREQEAIIAQYPNA